MSTMVQSVESKNHTDAAMVNAMDILHDPAEYQGQNLFGIELPRARSVINGVAHEVAGTVAGNVLRDVRFTDDEWNQAYESVFSGYRAGFEAGYLLVRQAMRDETV